MDEALSSHESIEWRTPREFWELVDAEFHFTCDVCASPGMEQHPTFFSPQQDGLRQAWAGICWCNPPYGPEISQWVKKAYDCATDGVTTVLLVPARTDTRWFHEFCGAAEIRFLKGRLTFEGSDNPAPFPAMLVIFHGHLDPGGIVKLADRPSMPLIQQIALNGGDHQQRVAAMKGASARAAGFPAETDHGYAGANKTAWENGWRYCDGCLSDPNYKPVPTQIASREAE